MGTKYEHYWIFKVGLLEATFQFANFNCINNFVPRAGLEPARPLQDTGF